MKDIGGYFELEQLINKEHYKDLIRLNSGRNSLLYLVKVLNIKKLHIPFFICDSVPIILEKNKCNYEFYRIDKNFKPLFKPELKEHEYVFIVNFYGQITNSNMRRYKKEYRNIIIDNSQAFFQLPVKNVNTIYTCRKFFGVPDGAYLSSDVPVKLNLETDKSAGRLKHILGRYEGNASEFYSDYQTNEQKFYSFKLKKMSKLTQNILGAIDYPCVVKKRNENFKYLHSIFSAENKLNISIPNGPFAYPFYSESAELIRDELKKKNIYIPTLWPNVLKTCDIKSNEYKFSNYILPLPCDQRYNIKDMSNIAESIKNAIENSGQK